jgi:hypothetical protein
MDRKRVLLGHLNSNGDCLFATVIARQIKEVDYPNCHLTWAVNSKCKQSVFLNPYVDDIWEIPTEKTLTNADEWSAFVSEVENKKKVGEFDFVFLTQIAGENLFNYDGGIRSSTYNNYSHKITVSHEPIIRLSETEVENVKRFAETHRLGEYKQVILIECSPNSFDVALNAQSACQLASDADFDHTKTAFILSSNKRIGSAHQNIIDASELSFRENAELTKYCDLLIGCASGISWLATTDWAKKLDMILVIAEDNEVLPSMIYDHEYLNLPTDHIIEIKSDERSMEKIKNCLRVTSTDGFGSARKLFNEKIKLLNYSYLNRQLETSFADVNFAKFFSCLSRSIKRNGIQILFTSQFIKIIRNLQSRVKNKLLKVIGLKHGDTLIKK